MKPRILRRPWTEAIWFTAFAVAYYLPFLVDSSGMSINVPGVRELLGEALRVPRVCLELARNAVGHLLLLAAFFCFLSWMSTRFASATRLNRSLSRVVHLYAGWIFLLSSNGVMFGLSDYSSAFDVLSKPWIAAAAAGCLVISLGFAIFVSLRTTRLATYLAGLLGLIGLAAFAPWSDDLPSASARSARNVIVIGVDSLSPQMARAARKDLPNIAGLLESGLAFERAYTPLGRTFPAWISLLSGRSPAEHGAIFNLRGIDRVERHDLVTHALMAKGYRTVFAIDERRFSNLDESFGFNLVVGPRTGALDFVLQRFNDTPLTNLLLQTPHSVHLFPFSRLNAASHANYDARGFVDGILAALSGTDRIMLAAHFESAHFPFKTRHGSRPASGATPVHARHVRALRAVDAQVGQLLRGLGSQGFLEDALVLVLSDHGESLGDVEARITRAGVPAEISAYGHGGSLMSEHQSRVVLGAVRFKAGLPADPAQARTEQVSLTDVRSMIEHYAETGALALKPTSECITVETGIRFAAASNYQMLDERAVAAEGVGLYEIDPVGRLRLKEDKLPSLVEGKDIGLRCKGRLTYYSAVEGRYFAYEIDDSTTHFAESEARPDDVARIEEYRAVLRGSVQR